MAQEKSSGLAEVLEVKITRVRFALDPPIEVFNVEMENQTGRWTETFGSEGLLCAFLRGLQARTTMGGELQIAEIPQKATVTVLAPGMR